MYLMTNYSFFFHLVYCYGLEKTPSINVINHQVIIQCMVYVNTVHEWWPLFPCIQCLIVVECLLIIIGILMIMKLLSGLSLFFSFFLLSIQSVVLVQIWFSYNTIFLLIIAHVLLRALSEC